MNRYAPRPQRGRRATSIRASSPDIAVIADDLCAILGPEEPVGFVHHAGNVFVALRGSEYGYAVEIGQALTFDRSVAMVRGSLAAHR